MSPADRFEAALTGDFRRYHLLSCTLIRTYRHRGLRTTLGPLALDAQWDRCREDAAWPAVTCPFNAPYLAFLPPPPTYVLPSKLPQRSILWRI